MSYNMIFTLQPTRITGRRIPVNNNLMQKENMLPNSVSILNGKPISATSTNNRPKNYMKRRRKRPTKSYTTASTTTTSPFDANKRKNHRHKYGHRYRINNEISVRTDEQFNSINSRERIVPIN